MLSTPKCSQGEIIVCSIGCKNKDDVNICIREGLFAISVKFCVWKVFRRVVLVRRVSLHYGMEVKTICASNERYMKHLSRITITDDTNVQRLKIHVLETVMRGGGGQNKVWSDQLFRI